MKQAPGIYRIDGPGRFYVGSAKSVSRRWIEHKRDLRRGDHANPHLQAAWNKHGEAAFSFTVLEWVDDAALLLKREQHWLGALKAVEEGYNLLPTAGSSYGVKRTEETKARMSEAHKGRKHGPMSAEQRRLYSELYVGRSLSEETRQRMSEARRGRIFSAETREKIAAAHRGKRVSDATREKLAAANRGKRASAETRAKMSAAAKGRVLSDEHRAKLSAAAKSRYQKV